MTVTKMIHKEEHLGSSEYITDIVIRMSDGLTRSLWNNSDLCCNYGS